MKTRVRWRRMWIVTGFVAAALSMRVAAQTSPAAPTADQVKAAYLHKFAGYVDWPPKVFADPATPFVIGVVGADGVHAELVRLVSGRTVQGRAVEVRRVTRAEIASDAFAVHVVFVGRELHAAAAAIVTAYRGRPVLTVTDMPRGADGGAVINFIESDKRVRFEAAPAVAEQGGLRLSSRLLAVAERVVGATP